MLKPGHQKKAIAGYGILFIGFTLIVSCSQPKPNYQSHSDTLSDLVLFALDKDTSVSPANGSLISNFSVLADSAYKLTGIEAYDATGKDSAIINIILKGCDFDSMTIKGNQSNAIFCGPVSFSYCKFDSCEFQNVTFESFVWFYRNTYDSAISFLNGTFKNSLNMQESFKSSPYFFGCYFGDDVSFIEIGQLAGSSFESDLIFEQCTFNKTLDLYNCTFEYGSRLRIPFSELPDTLILSNCSISGGIDLTDAYPNPEQRCVLQLDGADISKIKLQYQYFKLYFPDRQLIDKTYKDRISSTYELLLNNFKTNGFNDSYEELDKEYKLWQSRENFLLRIDYIWWQFGYEKWMIVLWSVGFILLFSVLNYLAYRQLQSVYPIEKLNWNTIKYHPDQVARFLRKCFLTLIYTGIIFFRFSIDLKNLNFTSHRYVAYIIFQYTIGLVCTGFLINWIIS